MTLIGLLDAGLPYISLQLTKIALSANCNKTKHNKTMNQVYSSKQINSSYINIRNKALLTERDFRNRYGHSSYRVSTIQLDTTILHLSSVNTRVSRCIGSKWVEL